MNLPYEFLLPYYTKGDNFPNLLARSTYLGKYCRNGESWVDTVLRVVLSNTALDPTVTDEEVSQLFHAIWSGWALPPGRGLWTGGVPGMPVEARYNCAKSDTLIWANEVLRPIGELAGKTVNVLTVDGRWLPAEIKSFGRQPLQRVSFRPGTSAGSKYRMSYDVTPNHRWITNRGVVTDLKVGDRVQVEPKRIERDVPYRAGYLHGLIYGDGCETTGRPKNYQIRLCGDKAKFLPALTESAMYVSHSFPPSYNGEPHVRLRTNTQLKHLPDESETLSYQAGFLEGWLATDGCKQESCSLLGVCDPDGTAWVEQRAPLLGYCITGRQIQDNETNYGTRKHPLIRLTLVQKSVDYVVDSIEDLNTSEEVFCAVEPVTKSFTLVGGMPTGNCWGGVLTSIDDWCWLANMLMCGGGVGMSLLEIHNLREVMPGDARMNILCSKSHSNVGEVMPDVHAGVSTQVIIDDTRQGWVEALRHTLECAFNNSSLTLNLSSIRPRGTPIKTFGGIACGPGPLASLCREVWAIVRKARGRKLNSVECLDITNHIGVCIKSGNVRRSALIVLGRADDTDFRDAKKSWEAVKSHRHSSNNSIVFDEEDMFRTFDWRQLVEDNAEFGEPGILNLWKIRQTDPLAVAINPCGEIPLHNREACNLAEVFPALIPEGKRFECLKLITRYSLRQRLEPMNDFVAEAARVNNMRIGVGLGGICDFNVDAETLNVWHAYVRGIASLYAQQLGVVSPIATTTVKPSGTISLLNGSSPGIHAPFAPFYMRRTRISKQEPMAEALISAGVPYEPCVYDSTGNTLVFSFPMAAKPGTTNFVSTESVKAQVERQVMVQREWADNAVSTTISFHANEKDELADLLKTYAKEMKSISCLPKAHGYEQPPYEEITELQFREMTSKIDSDHPLTSGGELDTMECEGGVCPVK